MDTADSLAQVATPAQKTTCALKFANCTALAWGKVLTPSVLTPFTQCMQAAEECGLFDGPGDAGAPFSPACGVEIADCYIKNPGNFAKCRALPCRTGATGGAGNSGATNATDAGPAS